MTDRDYHSPYKMPNFLFSIVKYLTGWTSNNGFAVDLSDAVAMVRYLTDIVTGAYALTRA